MPEAVPQCRILRMPHAIVYPCCGGRLISCCDGVYEEANRPSEAEAPSVKGMM